MKAAVGPDDEVVVVDSASTDPAVRQVAVDAAVPVVRCERPGLSRARNLGVLSTSAPIVAFTDDDCLPTVGWVRAVDAAFAEDRVGFVTGPVLADRTSERVLSVSRGFEARRFVDGDSPEIMGHGANMSFRRSALQAAGPFDELLGAGGVMRAAEDQDMFWRVLRAGFEGRYDPVAVITHVQWRPEAQFVKMRFGYGLGAGALAVKMLRIDRDAGRAYLGEALWHRGVKETLRALRRGDRSGAIGTGVRAAGVVAGAVRVARRPVNGPCFRP
ncbi:MAG: hypothetical protein QOJ09_2642 [Actinomycetota bacterium]|nr:hypothetical protein [Actinomycetota bacterium]